ncbi:IS256 family transposase ISCob1 [bioreactor metagenome]|uniref:IS256 family transposase ISCob1 n=1 Tax=bioreactor metagenome TaxID=1076179 RepID=A0A645A4E5_9ZZZZ
MKDMIRDFEPKIIQNYENDISGIEVSHTLVAKITDRVLPLAQKWQNRALEVIYPIVFMDAIHYKVRSEGRIINKAAYIAIGISLEGIKEVLGICYRS